MNCRNCGATMKLIDQRDYFVCEFCTSFYFPPDSATTKEKIKVLGEYGDRPCAVCSEPLVAASVDGIRVQHCERCRGILAGNDEFAAMVRSRRAGRKGPPTRPKPLDPTELGRSLSCPSCGKKMDVHPYYGPGNVIVDTCGRCRLIWLDHGEMTVIENAPGAK